jgi:hypothetical protein
MMVSIDQQQKGYQKMLLHTISRGWTTSASYSKQRGQRKSDKQIN